MRVDQLEFEYTVEVHEIKKTYGEILALDHVTFNVPRRGVAFLGPNGSGKTTFIKIILGLLPKDTGSFKILGLEEHEITRIRNVFIGYMPEVPSLMSGITGVRFVRHFGQLSGLPYSLAMRRAHEVLDYVGLEEERYRKIQDYSTGMKQRLLFAQALVADPVFLILDEPTEGLDPQGRKSILSLIKELVDEHGKHVLMSTHILKDTEGICQDVILLNNGEVAFTGKMNDAKRLLGHKMSIKFTDQSVLQEYLQRENISFTEKMGEYIVDYDEALKEELLELASEKNVGVMKLSEAEIDLDKLFMKLVMKE